MSETTAGAAAPPPTGNTGETAYVVLHQSEDSGTWQVLNPRVWAKTTEAAVRSMVSKQQSNPQKTATFVAVPARSWKPVKVSAKVETTILIEEAS